MNKKATLLRSLQMILLALFLTITLIACGAPKDSNLQETKETNTQNDSTVKDEPAEQQTQGIKIEGLDFNSTTGDVEKKLGKPLQKDVASEVSVYYYDEDLYSGNTIYFIDGKVCAFLLDDNGLAAPQGIKAGDSIVKAMREYSIPEELSKLGISAEDSDGEMLQKIIDRNQCVVFFNHYENSRISVSFRIPDGIIDRISVIRANEKGNPAKITPSDFQAGAKEIAKKFGYPDEIVIYDKAAFEFSYKENPSSIKFLQDSSVRVNSFDYREDWRMPYDIKIGDPIHDVFETLYVPDDMKKLGILLSMKNSKITDILKKNQVYYFYFDSLPDYDITIGMDETGAVSFASIDQFNKPQYSIEKASNTFVIPAFDSEAIAAESDLYLSDCSLGSSRQEVFQMLGSPQKTEEGYDQYTSKYQDCSFGSSTVYFLSVDNYKDLATGTAWYYYITDPSVTGPRGLCVGDRIERVMDVFPGRNDIDFKTISEDTSLYADQENPEDETNSATVWPAKDQAYAGTVSLNVDWFKGISFEYEDGIITAITLSEMLD